MLSKRERLARIAGNVWSASLLQQLFRGPSLVCLTHHRVADRVEHDPDVISATPAQLLGQAEWLKASYPILDGEQVKRFVCGELSLRQPSIALTFDDAYEDNFEVGRILMERFGIPAMFFVPTAFIETGVIPVWDRLGFAVRHSKTAQFVIPRMGQHGPWPVDAAQYGPTISSLMAAYSGLPRDLQLAFVESCESAAGCSANDEGRRSPFMTWNQIRKLSTMGHTIGAHTHTHPVLASLPTQAQQAEIESSRRILAEHLDAPVTLFAYPYGKPNRSFTVETKEIVRGAGFSAAFAFAGGFNRPGQIDRYEVKRMKVDTETSISMFRARVSSRGWLPV
jgi:peptidoglycan/xylan/chitin deacetylase (PgdA/CDA1 family)